VYILQHLRIDRLALGFDVSDLATTIPLIVPAAAATSVRMAARRSARRESHRWFRTPALGERRPRGWQWLHRISCGKSVAAAEVIVVQRRQIIVDQGVGVDEFDGAGGVKRGCDIAAENARRLETEDRAYSLPAGENTVTHCRMNGRRL